MTPASLTGLVTPGDPQISGGDQFPPRL
jgi:hypothetical protein